MAMKQRDCVLKHTIEMVRERKLSWTEGQDMKPVADKAFLGELADRVTADIASGACEMRNLKQDPKELRRYVVGMVNDAYRKDKRMNGGVRYEFKNPGSRAGAGDEVLRTLRAYLASSRDEAERACIQAEIDLRLEQVKPRKTVDLSVLPADVLARLNIRV